MTHREARRKLGTRRSRREGTKTRVIPGGGGQNKKPPKYKTRRASKGKKSNAAKVWELVQRAS